MNPKVIKELQAQLVSLLTIQTNQDELVWKQGLLDESFSALTETIAEANFPTFYRIYKKSGKWTLQVDDRLSFISGWLKLKPLLETVKRNAQKQTQKENRTRDVQTIQKLLGKG